MILDWFRVKNLTAYMASALFKREKSVNDAHINLKSYEDTLTARLQLVAQWLLELGKLDNGARETTVM